MPSDKFVYLTQEARVQRNMFFTSFSADPNEAISPDELIEQVVDFFMIGWWRTLSDIFCFGVFAAYEHVSLQLVQDPSFELIIV